MEYNYLMIEHDENGKKTGEKKVSRTTENKFMQSKRIDRAIKIMDDCPFMKHVNVKFKGGTVIRITR